MSAAQEVIDGNGTPDEQPQTELTIQPANPATLFRTDDPVLVLERATEVANALNDVIAKRKLFQTIGGKDHVLVEGWQTLGAMLGVTAVCEWTRPVQDGWEARVVAQTLDGRTIGAAEAQCLAVEGKPWNKAEGYAIRSMAQTRATSKALASVLRFVVTLAGYQGTPAEEAVKDTAPIDTTPAHPEAVIDDARARAVYKLIQHSGLDFDRLVIEFGTAGADAPKINRADSIAKAVRELTPEQADEFEKALKAEAS